MDGRMFEKKAAKILRGKTTPASGALWNRKADIETKNFLVECKFTDATQYILKNSTLQTIARQAINVRKLPALVVGLCGKEYAIIDLAWLQKIDELLEKGLL